MFEPEVLVRIVIGGLLVGGVLMFLRAPESRKPEVPRSVPPAWDSEEAT